jgi:hypothetical protein
MNVTVARVTVYWNILCCNQACIDMMKKIQKSSNLFDFVHEFLLFLRQLRSEQSEHICVKTVFIDESLVHLCALS